MRPDLRASIIRKLAAVIDEDYEHRGVDPFADLTEQERALLDEIAPPSEPRR